MKRILLPYQSRWVRDKSPLKVIEKSRRIGLSWCEAYDAVMHAAEGAGDVYYQSFDHEMTRGFVDDCAGWAEDLHRAASAVEEGILTEDGRDIKTFSITLESGKAITAMTSAPRAFRSKGRPGDLGIVDEAAFVENLEEVLKAALAFLFWGGRIHVLSTHNGEGNPFNLLCRDIENGKQPGSLHKTTFNDAVADGVAERVLETTGQPVTRENVSEWVARVRHTYRHNAAEELDCIPAAGAGSFLTWEQIRRCQHADAGKPELYEHGFCYLGIDVARRRHLWVATVFEEVGDVLWAREMVILANKRFAEQRDAVKRLMRRYRISRMGVDQTGMGEMFFEVLQDDHGEYMVEGYLFTAATKLALGTSLLQRVEDVRIRFPDDDDTTADLRSVKREGGTTGPPRLVADEKDSDGHADRFWSFAMACRIADEGTVEYAYTPAPKRRSSRHDDGPGDRRGFWKPDHSSDWRGGSSERGAW